MHNITRLSSHTYELPTFKITENGLEEFQTAIIQFVKGSKDAPVHPGFITDHLIGVCKMYLESVNVGDLENSYTTAAIAHLDAALEILDQRQKDRQARGVAQTYKK